MKNMKLKVVALVVLSTVLMSSLNLSTIASENLLGDVDHDGIIGMKDAVILGAAWDTLAGDPDFNPNCDFNGDGIINIKDASLLGLFWTLLREVRVSVMPQALNLKSRGNWITCIISLPEGVNASDVDVSSIRLNGTIAVSSSAPIGMSEDGLVVKFDRAALIALISESLSSKASKGFEKLCRVTLTVTGKFFGKLDFAGSDTIRVIHSGCV